MSTGQNKVTSQMVSYFKYCKSINMYDHPHDTGDQSRHKNFSRASVHRVKFDFAFLH